MSSGLESRVVAAMYLLVSFCFVRLAALAQVPYQNLDEALSLSIGRWVERSREDVSNAVGLDELCELG